MEGGTLNTSDDDSEDVEMIHTDILVPCDKCNLWFPTQSSLEHHQCAKLNRETVNDTVENDDGSLTFEGQAKLERSPVEVVKEPAEQSCQNEGASFTGEACAKPERLAVEVVDGPEQQSCENEAVSEEGHSRRSSVEVYVVKELACKSRENVGGSSADNVADHLAEAGDSEIKEQRGGCVDIEKEVENVNRKVTQIENNKRSSDNKYFKCGKCTPPRQFASSKALQKHLTRCHSQVLEHTCHNCGHCFKHPIDKVKSIRTVYAQTDIDAWMCEVCCKALSSLDEIQEHKLQSHSGNSKQSSLDRFACKFCSKTFQFQCHLRNHEMVHTNTKAHKCPHCSKSFRMKGQLDTHINIHTKQTIYSCGECGANFYKATALHHHLRSKHQEWRFKCRFCQKGHVTKNDMLVHERIHTGVKPYICEECGAGFPRKQNLNNHLKAHRNERSYPCTECGKAFFRKSTLKEHYRTHTGEKPYQCQRCSKRFTQKSHLRAHLRSHLRQELERHQPVNESDTGNSKDLVDTGGVDVQLAISENTGSVEETGNTNDEPAVDSNNDAALQNQSMQNLVSATITECVIYVENDNSVSDTQTAEDRDDSLVIQVES